MPQGKVKFFLVVFFLLNAHFQAASGETYHVDINGCGDFTSIQSALDGAGDFDEIEVWPGTYHETIDFMGKSVRLYSSGGPEVTTIDANGGYHAVQCVSGEDANTILAGFTITGGNATGSSGATGSGGGMYNDGSSPMVTGCTFSGNKANDGGGMYNFGGRVTVSNCTFSGNTSGYMGGGMYNFGGGITVTGCTFTGNEAIEFGGGMSNTSGSPKVTDCTFSGNKAGSDMSYGFGGGMYNNSTLTLVECTFSGNVAEGSPAVTGGGQGGGIYNTASDVNILECTFSVNHAEEGGGMYNRNSSPTISGCIFIGNLGTQYDGAAGMQNYGSNPTVVNCTFSGNAGIVGYSPDAGGMLNQASSNPAVTSCTFIGNRGQYVGGIYNDSSNPTVTGCTFIANVGEFWFAGAIDGGNPVVTNCILWGNTPIKGVSSTAVISYSDVEGGWAGTGNIDADPCFVDADGGDFRLSYDSPCIEGGDPNYAPGPNETDLDGYPRIIDGDCNGTALADMGAYEFNYAYMGDLDYNCGVDFFDFSVFASAWQRQEGDAGWNRACDISNPPDDYIDLNDLLILCNNWLAVMP